MRTLEAIPILKMKRLLLCLFLWSEACAQATPKDTLHHVRVVSAADSTPLRFATLTVKSQGIVMATWEADADGYIRISRRQLSRDPQALISLQYPGFTHSTFKADTLWMKDTIVLRVKPQPVMLAAIRIVDYKVPLVEKKSWQGSRRQQAEEASDVFPVYASRFSLADEALQNGLWLDKDTISRRSILAWDTANMSYENKGGSNLELLLQRYLMNNISYPRLARDLLMEETVYMAFEFGEKGEVSYLQVMKGKDVGLVLEVANALARMPRINLRNIYRDEGSSCPAKHLKPVRLILPVQFILQ